MNATPGSSGSDSMTCENASRPPADAPTATIVSASGAAAGALPVRSVRAAAAGAGLRARLVRLPGAFRFTIRGRSLQDDDVPRRRRGRPSIRPRRSDGDAACPLFEDSADRGARSKFFAAWAAALLQRQQHDVAREFLPHTGKP